MATQVGICNRALQLVGADQITSINDNSRSARALLTAYDPVRIALLRAHPWNFAIRRASLPASATPPIFGYANAFPLPPGFLDLLPPDPYYAVSGNMSPAFASPINQIDWQIEGGNILSNDGGPLNIRFISSSVTEADYDALFSEAFAAQLGLTTCEQLTQSNTKKADCKAAYEEAIDLAKKRNAFENQPALGPVDNWISLRF